MTVLAHSTRQPPATVPQFLEAGRTTAAILRTRRPRRQKHLQDQLQKTVVAFSDTNEPRLTIRAESIATFITCQQGGWLASFPPPLHCHDCFNVSVTTTVKSSTCVHLPCMKQPMHRVYCTQTAMPMVLPLCQDCHRPTSAAAPDRPPSWKLPLHLLPTWQCVAGPADMCDANLQDTCSHTPPDLT
jgi:hypothetical protein